VQTATYGVDADLFMSNLCDADVCRLNPGRSRQEPSLAK